MKIVKFVLMVCVFLPIAGARSLAQRAGTTDAVRSVGAEVHPEADDDVLDDRRGIQILGVVLRGPGASARDAVLGDWQPTMTGSNGRPAMLELRFRLRSAGNVTAELIGASGQHFATWVTSLRCEAGGNLVSISLAGFEPGDYFVRLHCPAGIAQQRLVLGR